MSASFGVLLIFHEERGYTCTLELADGLCDLGKVTVAGFGIGDDGKSGHSAGNPTRLIDHLLARQNTQVRSSQQGSGDRRPADPHSLKPGIFDQPRR